MISIKIIAGSVRPGRFNIQPAEWILNQSKQFNDEAEFELLDLKEVNLPFLDEEKSPMSGIHEKEHSKQWAKIIGNADGYIFVTPEYNHSVSPALKNAVDYLYHEWNYKPLAFISYGSLAGGSRAVEHMRGVAAELKMFDLREHIMLPNYWNDMDESGKYKFTKDHEVQAEGQLSQLIFWAKQMRLAREQLSSA